MRGKAIRRARSRMRVTISRECPSSFPRSAASRGVLPRGGWISRTALGVAALCAWLVTVALGLAMMLPWVCAAARGTRRAAGSGARRP